MLEIRSCYSAQLVRHTYTVSRSATPFVPSNQSRIRQRECATDALLTRRMENAEGTRLPTADGQPCTFGLRAAGMQPRRNAAAQHRARTGINLHVYILHWPPKRYTMRLRYTYYLSHIVTNQSLFQNSGSSTNCNAIARNRCSPSQHRSRRTCWRGNDCSARTTSCVRTGNEDAVPWRVQPWAKLITIDGDNFKCQNHNMITGHALIVEGSGNIDPLRFFNVH